ncbi:uncharacterized protein A4U43_C05F19820 [Asparagus officinalis]|uniref:Uncharacterized protein n=1 Tax=Asparagus officinalis TaxID=4686 RepID=A0A5P1ESX3_ASPOF|nr:uncharacterized protein A4U43_C05F19820 [Asparagus officinalis]
MLMLDKRAKANRANQEGTNVDAQIQTNSTHDEYFDVGDPIWSCSYCDANMCSSDHSRQLDSTIAQSLKEMFDEYNPFAKSFRMVKERFDNKESTNSLALAEIEKILRGNGKTLGDYPPLLVPESINLTDFRYKLIQDELNYDKESLAIERNELLSSLTNEHRHVYDTIIDAVF